MAKKKTYEKRGSRTHGKGGIQPGGRGGRGFAGSKKHRKTWIMRYKRDHLGKRGFKHRNAREVKAVNLREVDRLAGDKKEVNLKELGFDKVLGVGEVSKKMVVKARAFSRHAKEKIEKAGGKAVVE